MKCFSSSWTSELTHFIPVFTDCLKISLDREITVVEYVRSIINPETRRRHGMEEEGACVLVLCVRSSSD